MPFRTISCAELRTKARTGVPRATSALVTALPVLPPAPVTRIMPDTDVALALRVSGEFEQPARAERNFQQFDAAAFQIERVFDCLREQRPARNGAGFTGSLDAHRIERRFRYGE